MDLGLAGTGATVAGADGALKDVLAAALAAEGAVLGEPQEDPAIVAMVLPTLPEGPLSTIEDETVLLNAWDWVERTSALFRDRLPAMEARGAGRLLLLGPVEIKSMTGRDAALDRTIGLGLLGLMKALSGEVGPQGITCNSVLLDPVPANPDEVGELIASAAATACYLASPRAAFLTGLVIGVDRARSGSPF